MKRLFGIYPLLSTVIIAAIFCLSGLVGAACPSMDLTGNCRVDLGDFALLAEGWMFEYEIDDLADFAEQWLTYGSPDITWVAINDPEFVGEMSRYETTNAQYALFLNTALHDGYIILDPVDPNYIIAAAGDYHGQRLYQLNGLGKPEDIYTDGGASRITHHEGVFTVSPGFADHPVTYVSLYGAAMFADYYGWRLPTEEEWQGVANYDGTFIYGCGETIDNDKANYHDSSDHPDGTTPVGYFVNYGYGMADMAGNVQEWTTTVWENNETYITTKGGWWFADETFCKIDSKTPAKPAGMYRFLGFRVCR